MAESARNDMKTLREPKKTAVYLIECKNRDCQALLECEKSELKFHSDQRDGSSYELVCPHCKVSHWIDANALVNFEK